MSGHSAYTDRDGGSITRPHTGQETETHRIDNTNRLKAWAYDQDSVCEHAGPRESRSETRVPVSLIEL